MNAYWIGMLVLVDRERAKARRWPLTTLIEVIAALALIVSAIRGVV